MHPLPGDQGQTSLLGGTRVPKDHARIEAYGTVDELNSHLGMLPPGPGGAQGAVGGGAGHVVQHRIASGREQ
ncbi:MAG: ATP:cob(I)alamin adenosyltransferase [Flavobacteriales bacterium]